MSQLVDQFGRPFPPRQRPETREIAAVSLRDRWSEYPSRGLTPGRLAQIFYAADAGDLRQQAELFEEMEEKDGHLFSVMQTRRLAVLGLEHQVEAASESAEDKKIADFCREQLEALDLEGLLAHLMGAVGHGSAAAEPVWQAGAQWTMGRFNLIHPKNVTFVNSVTPLVVTEENPAGVQPAAFQLIYHRAAARSGHDTRNGVLRVCGFMYLFKNYALKDWAAFNEIFGMPLRLGKYEPSATPADREALRAAISALGSDAAGIISKSTEIEFVEASSRLSGTSNPYQVMAFFCNREMSKAVLGQTLTTDTEGTTGTYAAGSVQNEVRRDLLEADARALANTIRHQVLRPLVGFNFGWDKAVPDFSLLIQDSPDLLQDSQVLKNLVEAGAGSRIPAGYINDHFGIPEPKDGEETLKPAAPEPTQSPPGSPLSKGGAKGKGSTGGTPVPPEKEKPAAMRAVLRSQESPYRFEDNGAGQVGALPQDREMLAQQRQVEALVAQAAAASADLVHEMLSPVMDLVQQGEDMDLEEVQARLLELYPDLQVETLANLLYEARMRALMQGMM